MAAKHASISAEDFAKEPTEISSALS